MATYTQFDENGAQPQVATTTGWSDFTAWIDTQDAPLTQALTSLGYATMLPKLRKELQGLYDLGTAPKDVQSVIDQLISNLDEGEGAEIMLITNGLRK